MGTLINQVRKVQIMEEIMLRFRLSKDVYRTLSVEGAKRDMKPNRFLVEVLTATANKLKQSEQSEQEDWS